ncbi:MAG TPA: M56 family metallopeptidase, partial [Rhodothermales bacterium]|nr:M56 family metallopeptidase [Rhodothermales bacterium]
LPSAPETGAGSTLESQPVPFYEAYLNAFLRVFAAMQAAHWSVWLLMVWMVGVVVVLLRFSIGAAGVAWLAFRARPIKDREWLDLVEDSSRRIGLTRPVTLLRSTRTAMPMTWGLWRSVVLLPISANEWSKGRRQCVITHELAHVKRWDCLTQTLAQLASAISWFNPLVWMAARAMREEREKACDDLVLDGGIRPSHYAAHLLDIARSTRTTLLMPLGAVSMARPSQLETRVLSILDGNKSRSRLGRISTGLGMALTALLVLPLAALRPGAEAESNDLAFEQITTQEGDAYRWVGTMKEGQVLSVRGVRGDVQATPSKTKEVEVVALTDGTTMPVRILQDEQGLVVCVPSEADANVCAQDDSHEIDFLVRVPAGVRFSGSTVSGDVKAVALESDVDAVTTQGDIFAQTTGTVRAATVDGDVDLRTAHFGQATTVNGDIHARIGKTIWQGNLPFSSVNGDIIVELPAETHTDIDLQVEADGRLQTALPLTQRSNRGGEQFSGTFGRGGRQLSLHTVDGDITVTYAGTEPVRTREVYAVRPTKRAERVERRYYAKAEPVPQRKNEEGRIRAIYALLENDEGNTVADLSHALLTDRSERVRAKAAWALGEYDCGEALPALMRALKDESEAVRGNAIAALEELDNSNAVPTLAEALRAEPSSKVRRQLIHTLGEMDDERALESLHLALRDDDARVRRAAKEVLDDTFDIAAWNANDTEENAQQNTVAEVAPQIMDLQVEGELRMAVSRVLVEKTKRALAEWHLELADTDVQVLLAEVVNYDQRPFAHQMRRLGFKDATDEELLVARIFGLDDTYVESIREAGYCPTLGELVQLKMVGIDRTFLKKLEKEGHTELSIGELVALRQHASAPHTTSRTIEIEASLPPTAPEEEYGLSRGPNPGSRQRR